MGIFNRKKTPLNTSQSPRFDEIVSKIEYKYKVHQWVVIRTSNGNERLAQISELSYIIDSNNQSVCLPAYILNTMNGGLFLKLCECEIVPENLNPPEFNICELVFNSSGISMVTGIDRMWSSNNRFVSSHPASWMIKYKNDEDESLLYRNPMISTLGDNEKFDLNNMKHRVERHSEITNLPEMPEGYEIVVALDHEYSRESLSGNIYSVSLVFNNDEIFKISDVTRYNLDSRQFTLSYSGVVRIELTPELVYFCAAALQPMAYEHESRSSVRAKEMKLVNTYPPARLEN